MIPLLVVLTVVEVVLLVAVLAVYLVKIARSLERTIGYLAKISFGVRAIETQCEAVGPAVSTINGRLDAIASELAELERLAGVPASGPDGA